MKLVTKIAPVALLSLLLLPTESQSMMGRALGGLAGGGLVVAGAYGAERYGDRLGSVFARGTQTAQEQIVNHTSTRAAEQIAEKTTDVLSKTTNLASTLLRQADRTLSVAERIVDSRLFPYVVAGGAGYFLYHKIKKYFAGTNATIKEESKTTLEKISSWFTELKGIIWSENKQLKADIAVLQNLVKDNFGIVGQELVKVIANISELHQEGKDNLKIILERFAELGLTQNEIKVMLKEESSTFKQWIQNIVTINEKKFDEIHARLNTIETAQQEILQGQQRTEDKVDQIAQNLAMVVTFLGARKDGTFAQDINQIAQPYLRK